MRHILVVVCLCLFAVPVLAQDSRVTIAAGAAAQPGRASFTDAATFPFLQETARTEASYGVRDGIAFDVGGTFRVWRRFGIGVAVTRAMRDTNSETSGSFPHPFFFNTNRTGTWSDTSLDRSELGLHVSAAWQVIQAPRLNVSLFGGPTIFNFKQGVISDVELIENYPFDTIDARLVTGTVDGTAFGFHAGADVGWFFTRHVGVGAVARFTNATKKGVRIGEGNPFDVEVGGVQGGGGIRLRF